MNELAGACQHAAADAGGLARLDLTALHYRLQRNITSARDYVPVPRSRSGTVDASAARSSGIRPDQQRRPASPPWPLTQTERKPPSAGRAAGRRLLVCTRSSDVGSAVASLHHAFMLGCSSRVIDVFGRALGGLC
jgi:hypothetical protein